MHIEHTEILAKFISKLDSVDCFKMAVTQKSKIYPVLTYFFVKFNMYIVFIKFFLRICWPTLFILLFQNNISLKNIKHVVSPVKKNMFMTDLCEIFYVRFTKILTKFVDQLNLQSCFKLTIF